MMILKTDGPFLCLYTLCLVYLINKICPHILRSMRIPLKQKSQQQSQLNCFAASGNKWCILIQTSGSKLLNTELLCNEKASTFLPCATE